ncbi:DUF6314 family protein [Pseudooceanicola sp.]|uniref:DUF6314 family protein n=1 Tax=Pseudooceanicola sp. TaxID=1914328 RepID=UPI0035129E62
MSALAPFEGVWQLDRRVENALGPDARFTGEAVFTPDGAGLVLQETGEMRIEGQGAFRAERRYLWRGVGARIAVLFDDLRPFHDFDPTEPRPEAEHPCAPDHYRVAYDFTGWPRWHAVWQVAGPRKSYVMHSTFSR